MKKVITYGTFDLFHKGHYNILKRAREYGDYLIVGVTGESYDIARGKLSVHDDIATRIKNVMETGLVDKIIVEEYIGQKISDIIEYDIDTFVIGDDWKGKFDHLSKYCNMVYLERTKNISSTQLREENYDFYNIGIITDRLDENQITNEAAAVTGFVVKTVFSENLENAKTVQEAYSIPEISETVENLLESSDIVYIHTKPELRYNYIKVAINAGKHVICDTPFVINKNKQAELFKLAKFNNVALIDNIKMPYIKIFNQLLWMCQGGLIGEIVQFNCSISKNDRHVKYLFDDLLSMALCPMIKVMGAGYTNLHSRLVKSESGEGFEFGSLTFEYPNADAVIKVGNSLRVNNQMEIIGTKGTIRLKDNWWRCSYFELERPENLEPEIYNMNFSGNGFKYLLREMRVMFNNKKTESMGIFPEESIIISDIMEHVYNN